MRHHGKHFLSVMVFVLCCCPAIANASVFNFSWTGNPALDSTIVSSPDATLAATGNITINASPGSAFTLSDITSTNIHVTGTSITPFTFTSWVSASGTISADGQTATFNAASTPFFQSGSSIFFGCLNAFCGTMASEFDIAIDNGTGLKTVFYASAQNTVLSMHMTETPLPATLPLFATGIGALGLLGWRRKRKARASL